MNNYFENANTIQEKREILKGLSKPLQELVKLNKIESVNNGLIAIYREDGHAELKTLKQWNKEGKRVKKGQKALCLWGRPKEKEEKEKETDNSTTENEDLTFYPLCFVFSNQQVQ